MAAAVVTDCVISTTVSPRPRPAAQSQYCRKVFLGLCDSRSFSEPDSRDEQKIRDFMIQKYEHKRWYSAPTEGMKDEARRMNEAVLSKQPQTKPLRSLLGENAPKLVIQNNQSPQMNRTQASQSPPMSAPAVTLPQPVAPPASQPAAPPKPAQPSGFDLLGDLGSDPFASTTNAPQPKPSDGGFADFSNFNRQPAPASSAPTVFPISNTPLQPLGGPGTSASSAAPGFGGSFSSTPPSQPVALGGGGDKYAALADLDNAFNSTASTSSTQTINWGGTSTGGSSSTAGTGWSSAPQTGNTAGGPINWGGSSTANMGGGGSINWNGTNVSSGGNVPASSWNSSSGMAPTTAPQKMFGSATANPFGGTPSQAPIQQAGNPFGMAGGQQMYGQQPQAGFAQQQPQAGFAQQPGYGQFGTPPSQGQAPGGFGQYSMQNGGFGMMASTAPGFGMTQTAPAFAVNTGAQQPGFGGGWNQMQAQPAANPFMSAANQQQVPPRSGSTNPFL